MGKLSTWLNFYFRPYVTKDNQSPTDNDNYLTSQHGSADFTSAPENSVDAQQLEQTFLWMHQTQWQKEMLAKHGNTMTLFDATYKTIMYDLALCFVTVRMNAVYTVAAEFLVHSETNEQIKGVQNILKQ